MNTTTVRPHRARRRRRLCVPLLLMGPTIAAAVLLSAAPQAVSMFGTAAPSPATISGDQIELVKTNRELVALEPRDHRGDGPTPAPVPGGPAPTSKEPFNKDGYTKCTQNGLDAQSCCIIHDGVWTKDGKCAAQRMGSQLPGGTGLPTEAVDAGSPQTPPRIPD